MQTKNRARTLVVSRAWIRKEMVRIKHVQADRKEHMLLNFSATSPVERGTLKSIRGGKLSIHFFGDLHTVEVVFRTIISVSQISAYGNWPLGFLNVLQVRGDLLLRTNPETTVAPTDLSTTTK